MRLWGHQFGWEVGESVSLGWMRRPAEISVVREQHAVQGEHLEVLYEPFRMGGDSGCGACLPSIRTSATESTSDAPDPVDKRCDKAGRIGRRHPPFG